MLRLRAIHIATAAPRDVAAAEDWLRQQACDVRRFDEPCSAAVLILRERATPPHVVLIGCERLAPDERSIFRHIRATWPATLICAYGRPRPDDPALNFWCATPTELAQAPLLAPAAPDDQPHLSADAPQSPESPHASPPPAALSSDAQEPERPGTATPPAPDPVTAQRARVFPPRPAADLAAGYLARSELARLLGDEPG